MSKKIKSVISFILAIMMFMMCVPGVLAADNAPTVKKITPTDGAKNVQIVGTAFQVVFSENMDQKLVESAGSISIDNNAKILATKMVNSKTANIYISNLSPDTEYNLKFTSAIKSDKGVAIEPVTKKFTTGETPLYHQIPGSDMSDPIWRKSFTNGNGKELSFEKEGDNDVLKFKTEWADAPLIHRVAVEGGVTYKARARVKSDKEQALRVVMSYYTEGDPDTWYRLGEKGDQQVPAGEWVDIESTFTIPQDLDTTKSISLRITARVKGTTVLMDDIQFFEINTDESAPVMDVSGGNEDKLITKIEDTSKELSSQRLEALGIYANGDYSENATVSREVFSMYMAKILNADRIKSTTNFDNYTDVDVDYDGHIGTMVEMNILTANDNGKLRPDDAITFTEVCRAFVVALGHQKALENKTPVVAASNLGIRNSTGLNAASKVTYKDLNRLLDSFLEADCLYNTFAEFKTGKVLETMLGVTELKGIVEATSQTSFDKADGIGEGYVRISGKTYSLIDTNVSELLGKRVTYYVKEVDDEMCVLFFGNIEKNNKTLKLNSYDIMGYSDNEYSYLLEGNSSEKRAKIETDKIVIYNGRTTNNYQVTDLLPTYGWVELIDNDRNGRYDIVKITDYDTYVVESYDAITEIMRDKYENKYIDLSDALEVLVYKNGKAGKVGAIQNDNVVTVERSMDGKHVVLHISTNIIEGDIGRIENDYDRGTTSVSFYDIVHGSQIQNHVLCIKGYAGNTNTTTGDGGTFYIDAFGQIAAFKKGTGAWTYGYIKKVRFCDEEFVSINMFTENNTHEKISCAERVRIDSYRTKGYNETFNVLASAGASSTVVEPELVMYKTNKDGLISHIKTTRDTTVDDGFKMVKSITGGQYITSTSMVMSGGRGAVYVKDDTLLLQVPVDENVSDDALYKFSKAKNILSYKSTDYTVYSQSSNRLGADLLVVKGKTVWNQDSRSVGIVKSIKQRLSEDDEVITVVATTGGTIKLSADSPIDINSLTAPSGATGLVLGKGDYIVWRNRADGYVHDMSIIFKGNTKENLQGDKGEYAFTSVKCHFGRVTAKEGAIIEITNENGEVGLYNADKTPLYRVITSNGYVEKITANEISAASGTHVATFTGYENTISTLVLYE